MRFFPLFISAIWVELKMVSHSTVYSPHFCLWWTRLIPRLTCLSWKRLSQFLESQSHILTFSPVSSLIQAQYSTLNKGNNGVGGETPWTNEWAFFGMGGCISQQGLLLFGFLRNPGLVYVCLKSPSSLLLLFPWLKIGPLIRSTWRYINELMFLF